MEESHKIKFIEFRNYRYVYLIDDKEIDLKEKLSDNDISQRLSFINYSLKSMVDFRKSGINIQLREFIIFGYIFFKEELSLYFIYYIEKLILNCNKKKLTEVLILKYIFNAKISEVQYTIHSSTDKSIQKYNDMIMDFVTKQILEGKKSLIRKLLLNKDLTTISKIINLITLNSFLQTCGGDFLKEAVEYFDYIIKQVLLPTNVQLSLNGIIASGTGLSRKDTKDTKNIFKSKEKESLYKELEKLMNNYKSEFYLSERELKLLKYIEKALDNYNKLNIDELKELTPSRVLKICMELYNEKFTFYLNYLGNEIMKENNIINRVSIIMKMFENVDSQKANHIYTYYKMNSKNRMLEDYITKLYKIQVKDKDTPKVVLNEDKWIIYWSVKEKLERVTINFSELSNNLIKIELKQFYKLIIEKEYRFKSDGDGLPQMLTSSNLVIKSIKNLQDKFSISSAQDIKLITVYKLVKYLENDYKSNRNKKIKVSSIVRCISHLKAFIDWLIENDNLGLSKPEFNPFQYVVFKGVYSKNTEIIPEGVIDKMLFYLNELREDIQRMVLIMLNCGLRFKEVAYLEEDCVSESTEEYKVLKYIPYKVLEARIRNGLDEYHRIVIDDEVYKEIKAQIDSTKSIRDKYNAKEIFLVIGINDNLCMINSTVFCHAIQGLIINNNITDEQGHLWKISSRQYRKTLAVDMITKGNANEHEVANYLGHLSEETTKRYYAEVRKMKLAQMNTDFFKKKFELLMKKEHLENFNEIERKRLYVDFCLNIRDVEYGVCTKAFNKDTCKRRGDIFGCATCSKICTGRRYFNRWMGLYENQKSRIDLLIENYNSNNIKSQEYEKFKEYEKEKYLLDSFKIVIDKLSKEYGDDN